MFRTTMLFLQLFLSFLFVVGTAGAHVYFTVLYRHLGASQEMSESLRVEYPLAQAIEIKHYMQQWRWGRFSGT